MAIVSFIAGIAYIAFLLYFLLMWARFILDLAVNFSRNWRPQGVGLVIAELVFSLTDPPIRFVKRVVPPIRLGAAALDFSWSIVMLVVIVLMYISLAIKSSGV